ncbi:MAG TPA: hypothetical protein VL651_14010 [Bacteroidia bacterium]|jgi:hypothetical protein|nr:hypothetical protein [Bacteroidia bacterium]
MKQLPVIIFFLLFCTGFVHAQDTIVKKDGTKVPANITEVNSEQVTYKLPGFPDGPVIIAKKSELSGVIFRNGSVDTYNNIHSGTFGTIDHRQMVSINTTDLAFGLITLNWERNMCRDRFAIRIPLSTGIMASSKNTTYYYNMDHYYYTRYKIFSAGVDLLYYPAGQAHPVNYYCGLSEEFGYSQVNPGYFIDFAPYPYELRKVYYAAGGITNGMLINVNDRMSVSAYVTVGIRSEVNIYGSHDLSMCRAGIDMGYRFGKPSVSSRRKGVY